MCPDCTAAQTQPHHAGLHASCEGCKVRALAITSAHPVASLPGIDPVSAQGYPGFEAISWNAILAPASTPASVIATLQQQLGTIIRSDDIAKKFAAQYFSAVGSTPAELRSLMRDIKQITDRLDGNPAGYLLGREQPKEFTPK